MRPILLIEVHNIGRITRVLREKICWLILVGAPFWSTLWISFNQPEESFCELVKSLNRFGLASSRALVSATIEVSR